MSSHWFANGAAPRVWGHRGTRRGAPENTMPAFRMAHAQGVHGIELDVRCAKGGEVVVLHDPDMLRVAGADDIAAEATVAELQAYDLGDGARVPLLSEALAWVLQHRLLLNVEIKYDVPDLRLVCDAVCSQLAVLSATDQALIMISSFHPDAIVQCLKALPALAVGFLFEDEVPSVAALGFANTWGLHPRADWVTEARMAWARAQGAFVNAWTVNDYTQAQQLAALGVDGIITDDVPMVFDAIG